MNKKKIYLIGKKEKTKEETREAIIDYLNNFYDNKKSVDMVYNESEIFLKLQNIVYKKVNDDTRPFMDKIIDNKFGETNIIPTVADVKKYYNSMPEREDSDESLDKFIQKNG